MENRSSDNNNTLKCVILIGGAAKGTRFRPLSLEQPKPLFPVAGFPIIYHHIEACCKLPGMKEILLIGFYEKSDALNQFMYTSQIEFKIQIRYLQEFTALGTAGGLYHFRDQILSGAPDLFFVMNADVCCDFPLKEMVEFHKNIPGPGDHFTMLATEATRQQSMQYGCIVENKVNHEVLHYVEKPQTYVSTSINCGIYLLSHSIFKYIRVAFLKHQEETYNQSPTGFDFNTHCKETIHLEQEVFQPLAGSGKLFVYHTNRFWSQIKSAGAAIYANRHYLEIYRRSHPDLLAVGRPMPGLRSRTTSVGESMDGNATPEEPVIIGDVCIHPTASVASSAVLGPNVTIGRHVTVGEGVRVRESIILQGAVLRNHSCILNSIIGWYSIVGEWSRVEGSPNDPNPNKPFAKLEIPSVFNEKGQLNPSITVIGSNVEIPAEIAILNSIVLPHKELKNSFKNQIIL